MIEFMVLNKPMIAIPISNNQQEDNAQFLLEHNAAVILNEQELSSNTFLITVKDLINNESKRSGLAQNAARLVFRDASKNLSQYIIEMIEN